VLEQQRLALHHRQRRLGTDVAQAEHRGAVGDDGHRVLLDRQVVDPGRVVGDRATHPGHTGRVGHRQVVAVVDRHAGQHLDLAAVVHEVGAVEQLEHLDPVEPLDGLAHLLDVLLAGAVDDQVLFERRTPYVETTDSRDVAAGRTEGGGETAERAGTVVEPDLETDGVRSSRGCHGG
jgi:hypothetical protein